MRLPHERFDYSPIAGRRPWKLPRGARIAVWTIVNVEEWDIEKPMPRGVPLGSAGRDDRARRAELGVARLRDARRLLADARGAREAEDPRDDRDQRQRVPIVRAGGARDARRRLGVHGPRGEAGRDAPDPGSARRDPDGHRRSSASSPARRRRAGSGPGSPRRGRRSTSSPRRASSTSRTGSTTTSPTRSRRRRGRSCRCRTRSSSTTSR